MNERCATWARSAEVDPAGTAPPTEVFVLVEHPLPWPAEVGDDPRLAMLGAAARSAASGRSVRLQALACDAGSAERRVIVFVAGEPPFRGYGRLEGTASPDGLVDLVAELVASEAPAPEAGVTDVLVCTHGSRDVCCGSLGTRLWLEGQPEGVRVWRTSHTGGHRFAPTAITFPDGTYWAHLDAALLAGLLDRSLPAQRAAAHLRGCAAFIPIVQVADRAAFADHGWGWLDCARFAELRGTGRVELCFEAPDGSRGAYDVLVSQGRMVPVPDCGGDPASAAKSQTELVASQVRRWDG